MLLESFGEVIGDPIYIFAIIFAAIGIGCALIAKRITKMVRKTDEVKPDDKLLIGMKVAALILILVAFVLTMVGGFTVL